MKAQMTLQPVTRRTFLRTAAVALSAAAVAGVEIGCAPTDMAEEKNTEREIETPTFVYGNDTMAEKILVIYATRTGSTVGVASVIGETLGKRGYAVDVKPVQENPSLDGYQKVVIGSAINGGQWLPEAVEYVKNHQAELKQATVVLFCVHIMNLGDDEKSRRNRLAYLDAVHALVQPAGEGFFAGMGMIAETASGFERWLYRTFKIGPEGDCRDWEKIRGWAQVVEL